VRSLGADAVFDYNSPTAVADIRAHTSNKLYYIWDTIGTSSSYDFGAAILKDVVPPSSQIIHYGTILPPPKAGTFSNDVKVTFTLGYSVQGEAFELGPTKFKAKPEDYEFMVKWLKIAQGLLEEGKWKPHRQEVREGGLEGVLKGLEDMKGGNVSGVKLVYRIAEP
jgi:NADPH:quinone reductase-like Zn-dependent oxidoreductase